MSEDVYSYLFAGIPNLYMFSFEAATAINDLKGPAKTLLNKTVLMPSSFSRDRGETWEVWAA